MIRSQANLLLSIEFTLYQISDEIKEKLVILRIIETEIISCYHNNLLEYIFSNDKMIEFVVLEYHW